MAFYQFATTYFANPGGLASKAMSYLNNVIAGNLLFIVVGWETTGTPVTITGTGSALGNTFIALPLIAGPTHSCQAFYCINAIGGNETFTASFSGTGGTFIQIALAEYPMNSLTAVLKAHTENTGVAQNCTTTASITTTATLSLLIQYADGIAGTTSVASPWYLESAATGLRAGVADRFNAAGTYSALISNSSIPGGGWECGIVAFTMVPKAAAGGQSISC